MRFCILGIYIFLSSSLSAQNPYSPTFIDSAKTALKNCKAQQNLPCITKLQLDVADAYMFIGKPDSSSKYLKNVENSKPKDNYNLWRLNRLIALNFNNNGIFFSALQYAYRSLHYAEQLKNEEYLARSYTAIANIHGLLNQNEKAIAFHNKALPVYKKLNLAKSIILTVNNIGNCHRRMKNYDAAIKNYTDIIKIAEESNEKFWIGVGNSNLGDVLISQNKYREAIQKFNNSIEISRSLNDTLFIFQTQNSLVNAHLQAGNLALAEKMAELSLSFSKSVTQDTENQNLFELLFDLYQKKGDLKKAIYYQSEAMKLKEKSFENEFDKKLATQKNEYDLLNQRQLSEIQNATIILQKKNNLYLTIAAIFLAGIVLLTYLFYRKQREQNKIIFEQNHIISSNNIRLEQQVLERTTELMQANETLVTKNSEIENALAEGQKLERDHLAGHLHDNIGGYLSAMRFNLMAIEDTETPKPKLIQNMRTLLNNAYEEIRHLSHNILPKDLEKEGLVFCLKKLANQLNGTGNIKFTYAGLSHLAINQNKEYELYYVCLELTNNILKHSKASEAGFLITEKESENKIYIFDNGIGIDTSKKGFGLDGIQRRLSKFNGKIELNSTIPNELIGFSTVFVISL